MDLEWLKLFDQFPEKDSHREEEEGDKCDHDFIFDKVMTCQKCGIVDDKPLYIECVEAKRPMYYDYVRKKYFLTRLKYMNRHVQCSHPEYGEMVRELKSEKFETVYELKKLMKKHGMARHYRYLYSIYYDIKGKKVTNMTFEQIDDMANLFVRIEREFRKQHPHMKNMVSYNMMFYYIFQIYGVDNSALILPKNKNKIGKIIENLLKEIGFFP